MTPLLSRVEWSQTLAPTIKELTQRWSLTVGEPIDGDDVTCSWVAHATRSDGAPVVLKIGMPHMEGRDEIAGLRFWNGRATVRLLEFDAPLNAMLLERCEPGTSLRERSEEEQDIVIAGLLVRLWRPVSAAAEFRPLSELIDFWGQQTLKNEGDWSDAALVREGLRVFDELLQSTTTHVLLATDLHAGNVLRARREPWLAIDPKPFIGDPAYDATQHLLNCRARLRDDTHGTIERFAELLDVDGQRVRQWTFARAAAEPRENWSDAVLLDLARKLA